MNDLKQTLIPTHCVKTHSKKHSVFPKIPRSQESYLVLDFLTSIQNPPYMTSFLDSVLTHHHDKSEGNKDLMEDFISLLS